MRYVRKKRFRCIQAQDAYSFETEMNELLDVAGIPEVQYDPNLPFTAYVLYTTETQVAETIAEEYELAGMGKKCGDCPHLENTGDKRKKKFPCPYSKYGETMVTTAACNRYYEELEAGLFLAENETEETE